MGCLQHWPRPAPPAPPPSAAPQLVSVLLSSCFLPFADYGPLDSGLFCQILLPFGRQALGPVSKPRNLPANVAGARNTKDRPIRVGLLCFLHRPHWRASYGAWKPAQALDDRMGGGSGRRAQNQADRNLRKGGNMRKAVLILAVAVSYTHLRAHETDSYLVC